LEGELVADLRGGAHGPGKIQLVSSSTKVAEALVIAWLVDRGHLRYTDRIVDHWPEFARGGGERAAVTVRQLMMMRAGLPVFAEKVALATLTDRPLLS